MLRVETGSEEYGIDLRLEVAEKTESVKEREEAVGEDMACARQEFACRGRKNDKVAGAGGLRWWYRTNQRRRRDHRRQNGQHRATWVTSHFTHKNGF